MPYSLPTRLVRCAVARGRQASTPGVGQCCRLGDGGLGGGVTESGVDGHHRRDAVLGEQLVDRPSTGALRMAKSARP